MPDGAPKKFGGLPAGSQNLTGWRTWPTGLGFGSGFRVGANMAQPKTPNASPDDRPEDLKTAWIDPARPQWD